MSQIKRLQTIDADTLQSTAYEPVSFVVDDLLPQGLHLLAGAPKIGKSWLALWLCLCAAQGKPLWTFATRPCEVLYLCLEDSFQRIQSRLFDLTEDAPPTLHFAVMSQQLHNGLVEQIGQFLKEHPQTRLIVIDTLQRIRTAGNDANPYASDYRDIGVLKALADKHRIAILLVHHLRKMNDDDPMNMISGTTGLSGPPTATSSSARVSAERTQPRSTAPGGTSPIGSWHWSSTVRIMSGSCCQMTANRKSSPTREFFSFSLNCCAGSRKSAPLPRRCWKRSTLPVRRD